MASTQPTKGRDVILPTLDVFIQALNIAKDACGIPPAQIVLGSASTLLTMIQVSIPLLLREDELFTYGFPGHDGQLSRLRRPWTELRQCMSSTPPEIGWETIGRTQPGRPRCNWRSDYVSQASDSGDELLIHLPMTIDRRSVTKMQRNIDKRGQRNVVLRSILAKGDKDKIAAWNQDLMRVLHVFNVRSIDPVGNLRA
jgi:hypothetical protein